MRPSSRNTFASSKTSVMQGIVNTGGGPSANYEQDKIFLGWKIGDQEEYEEFLDEKWQEYGELSVEARKAALREFQQHVRSKDSSDYEEFYLDQESAAVIFRAGKRGSGKTFFMRADSNRSSKGGVLNIIVDPAHEYYTNNFKGGVQNKFKNLRRNESPQRIDTKVLMPKPVKKARNQSELGDAGMQFTEVFKFSFSDLNPPDVEYLLMKDVNPSTKPARRQDLRAYVTELNSAIQDGGISSFNDCEDLADKMLHSGKFKYDQGPNKNRANEIKGILDKYKKWEFLGEGDSIGSRTDEYDGLAQLLQKYNSVVLCLADNDNIPGRLEIKQLYLAFFIKRLRSLKQAGKLDKKIQLMIDEAHRFLLSKDPDDESDAPPAHWQIRQVIKEDRDKGFRVSMSSQDIDDIPERNFLKQADHVFIPMAIDKDTRSDLLDLYDVSKHGDSMRDKWQTIFQGMSKHQWFYIEEMTRDWALIDPASPLAYHKTED